MKKTVLFSMVIITFILLYGSLDAKENLHQPTWKDSIIVTALRERPIPEFSSVATKMDIPLQKIPLSVGVVNNSLINNQSNFILGDALKNISGINTQTGFGVHDYFIIRGLNSLDNGLILTDGTLEPEVTYYNLYNVERVEVLKGTGAFLYGSNPLSGTVNLVRKQPLFRKFARLSSTFGEFGTFRNSIDMGYGNPQKQFAARLNMLWEKADNYRDDKANEILAINPAITYYVKRGMTINANIEYIDSKYKPDTGLPLIYNMSTYQFDKVADIDRTTSFQTPFDASDQKIFRSKLNFDWKINNFLTYRNTSYYTRLDWQSQGTLINGASPTMTGSMIVNRSMSDLDDLRDLFGMQNEFVLSFETGKVKHSVLLGVEWSYFEEEYTYDTAPVIPAIDLYNPVETAVESQLMMYPYLRGDVNNKVIAPYFIDHMTVSDQLQIIGGVRYDVIKYKNDAQNYLTDRKFENASPMIGMNYAPVPSIVFYANTGKAYAPPSSQVVGEQDAEESTQYEIGVKQKFFDSRLNVDIAYYRIRKDNIAIPASDGISKKLGDQESKGYEIELSAEPFENWFTFISYAYTDAELTKFAELETTGDGQGGMIQVYFDRSGNTPAFTPQHILNLWTTKQLRNGLGFGGGIRYLSDQYIDADNIFKIDEALIFDAILYYKLNNYKFSVNFKNVTDEEYEHRGFLATSVIPAAPRAIYGKIEIAL